MPTQEEIVNAVVRQLKGKDLSQQAVMVLQKATARVLERIKQNVDVQVKEDSSPIVEKFVKNAATKMSAMTQQWADGVKNDLVVFPEGTRYIWRDGQMTTIIVEQQPQVRHINVYGKIYLLSLPYVQFILHFKNHELQHSLRVTCTKKPITDLDQAANFIPLGNIDSNHNVCMGNFRWPTTGNMTDVVNAVIGEFWQGQFNYDGGGHMLEFFSDNTLAAKTARDSREDDRNGIVQPGFTAWAKKTQENALYGTERTTKYRPGATFRRFLATDSGDKNGSQSIVNNLKQEIITAVGAIGGDIQAILTATDLETENREKVHVETLQGILKEIIVQAYAELWEYLQKQLQDERAKLQKEMQEAANKLKNKLKNDFVYYMDQKKKVW